MDTARRPGCPVMTFLVEAYWPIARVDAFPSEASRLDRSLAALRREGVEIEAISAMVVPEDETAFWIVDGPSSDQVALACARAGLPADRIVAVIQVRNGGHDERATDV